MCSASSNDEMNPVVTRRSTKANLRLSSQLPLKEAASPHPYRNQLEWPFSSAKALEKLNRHYQKTSSKRQHRNLC
jgi:hypothetical protein